MKRFKLLIPLLLFASPALSQSGLISGVVVVAQSEDGTRTSDVPVVAGGDEVGNTGDDGTFTIPEDTFDDGETVEIFVTRGDDPIIYVDREGENSCEDKNEQNANDEDDEDCVAIGIIKWDPGILVIHYGDDPRSDYETRDSDRDGMDDDDYDDEDGDYGVDIAIGWNGDWESVTFTVRGYWERPVEQVPLDLEVGLGYINPSEFFSVLMPMIEVSYRHAVSEKASVYGAGGLRFIRQKYSFEGFSSSNTETGVVLRAGAQYGIGPVDVFGEGDVTFAYSTSIFEARGGVRYGF